jgi:hypothetical protein
MKKPKAPKMKQVSIAFYPNEIVNIDYYAQLERYSRADFIRTIIRFDMVERMAANADPQVAVSGGDV